MLSITLILGKQTQNEGEIKMKNNNFEKIGFPGANDPEIDLRSHALKQYDYVMCLARQAKAEGEVAIQNALSIIKSFPRNFFLIQQHAGSSIRTNWPKKSPISPVAGRPCSSPKALCSPRPEP